MVNYSFVNPAFGIQAEPKSYSSVNASLAAGYCDFGGCAYYRIIFPMQALGQSFGQLNISLNKGIALPSPDTRSYWNQRYFGFGLQEFFVNTFLPYFKKYGIRLVYDMDDALDYNIIPEYNICRDFFKDAAKTLPFFLESADVVTVSTKLLRNFLINKFNLSQNKIKVLSNYMPRWWGDRYQRSIIEDRWNRHHGKRIRIGIPGGATHFDLTGYRNDDCTMLNEWIIANRKKYQFVFQNHISRTLQPYAEDFELFPNVPFLGYIQQQMELDLDLLIHPLVDHEFNRCKSVIKLLEPWGMGVPILVQDLPNYLEASPECCFHSLDEMLFKLNAILGDKEHYLAECERNYESLQPYFIDRHVNEFMDVLV